ncbi:MAG: hypothetical protein J6332_03835 [Abditibacteriota bacterium]|nr:hypothetical protein [Abditibacteriota bacterium]
MKQIFIAFLVLISTAAFTAGNKFPISMWQASPRHDDAAYKEMAEAGFNLVFDYTTKDQMTILDMCQKYGMKCQVCNIPVLAKEPTDPDFEKNLDEIIAKYKDHPAMWGYHIVDEPLFDSFAKIGAVTKYLKKKDPKHIAFTNLLPNYGSFLFGGRTFDDYVRTFIKEAEPGMMSYDHYSLMVDGNDRFNSTYNNLEVFRKACLDYNIPFNSIVLSIPHEAGTNRAVGYRDPNEAELRWQVYTALAYGAKGILYFCYHVPGWDTDSSLETGKEPYAGFYWGDAILNRDMTRNAKYYIVKEINAEIHAMEDVLLNADSVAVYNTGITPEEYVQTTVGEGKSDNMGEQIVLAAMGDGVRLGVLPQSTTPFPEDYPIQVSGGDFTMGVLKVKNDKYIMVVNRDYKHPAAALINFAKPVELKEIAPHGKPVTQVTPTYAVKTLAAGDGILIRVKEK